MKMKELEVELEELKLLVVAMGEGNRGVVPVVPVGEQYTIKWGKTQEMLGRAHLSLGGS